MIRSLPLISLSVLLSSCTWVQLTAEGETVEVAVAAAVTQCTRLGRTTARTMDDVATVDRSGNRLQEELLVLARNDAGAMGGNTIVPETVIRDGVQAFIVYQCP